MSKKQKNRSFDQYEDYSKEESYKKNGRNSAAKGKSNDGGYDDFFFDVDSQKNKSKSRRELNLQKKNKSKKNRFYDDDYEDYN